ncbi:MAG: bifunctional DNA-formamidopyrimidine glycosylase/DNA-(apurinic or apyrimidinic site) lyase [Gemmatimonadota bacterium]
MPELPEVETIVRDLRPELLGRKFVRATLTHDDVLRGVSRNRLTRDLAGKRVQEVFRRAKHAVIHLGADRLVIQPGMTGALLIHDTRPTGAAARYNVLTIRMDDGRYLVYRDVRRLGTILLLNDLQWKRYDAGIGPEPLDEHFTADEFRARLSKSRQAIKKVLMDQKYLAGVGNIYANEALFAAGIDPSKPASRVTKEAYASLYAEVRRILQAAIDSQGTTFRDYRTGTGQPGNFQLELKVYGREHLPCRQCGKSLVGTHDIDARITVFCYRCQA